MFAESDLSCLSEGEKGRIISFESDTILSQRMEEMGLVPGEDVEVIRFAPFGDPVEVQIKGYFLSLRKNEARFIKVQKY